MKSSSHQTKNRLKELMGCKVVLKLLVSVVTLAQSLDFTKVKYFFLGLKLEVHPVSQVIGFETKEFMYIVLIIGHKEAVHLTLIKLVTN